MISIEEHLDGLYKKIPIICGPTASGKSTLALEVCGLTGGELCACDSMQIYRHMDIGTAKATAQDQKEIPHHLIDILDPSDNFSVAGWRDTALKTIDEILNRRHLPIFCGGTGQYVSALTEGIAFLEFDVLPQVHQDLVDEAEEKGYESLHQELVTVDPVSAAKIHPNNHRRLIRALEIYRQTGQTMTHFNDQSKKDGPVYPFALFALDWDREALYDRMNQRVDQMLKEGLLEEVEFIRSLGLAPEQTAMQAIGYRELCLYLDGHLSYDAAVHIMKQKTRNYGKRQLTWFRRMPNIIWIKPQDSQVIIQEIT